MDLGTGLTVLGTALGGKDIIVKVLGPTAEYVGDELKAYTSKRIENLGKIFTKASKKIKEEQKDFILPPKVLKQIINEGSYAEDELAQEYYAGVLASSKTALGRDDRGASWAFLISQMSTYQIRLHYVFYMLVYRLLKDSPHSVGYKASARKNSIYIPWSDFIKSMDFEWNELMEQNGILSHTILNLAKEKLVDDEEFLYGSAELLQGRVSTEINEQGFVLSPSIIGIDLFLWVMNSRKPFEKFFDDDNNFKEIKGIYIPENAIWINKKTTPNN